MHGHNILGMHTGTSLERSTHAHVLSMSTMHICANKHASISMYNFHCCSILILVLSMTTSTLIGGQKRWQAVPQRPTGSIANECLSFPQQHHRKLYPILIPPAYFSCLTASVESSIPHIKATNLPDPAWSQPRWSNICIQGTMAIFQDFFIESQEKVFDNLGIQLN